LSLLATPLAQEGELPLGLYSFGDDQQVQAMGHGNDGSGNGRIIRIIRNILYKGAVDLQNLKGEALQITER